MVGNSYKIHITMKKYTIINLGINSPLKQYLYIYI